MFQWLEACTPRDEWCKKWSERSTVDEIQSFCNSNQRGSSTGVAKIFLRESVFDLLLQFCWIWRILARLKIEVPAKYVQNKGFITVVMTASKKINGGPQALAAPKSCEIIPNCATTWRTCPSWVTASLALVGRTHCQWQRWLSDFPVCTLAAIYCRLVLFPWSVWHLELLKRALWNDFCFFPRIWWKVFPPSVKKGKAQPKIDIPSKLNPYGPLLVIVHFRNGQAN